MMRARKIKQAIAMPTTSPIVRSAEINEKVSTCSNHVYGCKYIIVICADEEFTKIVGRYKVFIKLNHPIWQTDDYMINFKPHILNDITQCVNSY